MSNCLISASFSCCENGPCIAIIFFLAIPALLHILILSSPGSTLTYRRFLTFSSLQYMSSSLLPVVRSIFPLVFSRAVAHASLSSKILTLSFSSNDAVCLFNLIYSTSACPHACLIFSETTVANGCVASTVMSIFFSCISSIISSVLRRPTLFCTPGKSGMSSFPYSVATQTMHFMFCADKRSASILPSVVPANIRISLINYILF